MNESDEEEGEEVDENTLIEWFKELTEKKEDLLQMKPDDGRWWYTAVAAVRLARNRLLWIQLTDSYLEKEHLTPVQRDIAGNLKSMLDEPEILADLYLLACFFCGFLFHHFKFFQGVDPNIGKPGFLSFHILPLVYLMTRDLERLSSYQQTGSIDEDMKPFVAAVNQLPSEEDRQRQHWKAERFLKIAKDEMNKMFARWIDCRLFFLAAFGEAPIGRLIARFCLSEGGNSGSLLKEGEETEFESKLHGSRNDSITIDLEDFADFLVKACGEYKDEIQASHHVLTNTPTLEKISAGVDIWDRQDAISKELRRSILVHYGGLPSVTQHLERGNKNHNLCSINGRKERAIAARMNARSFLIDTTSVVTVDKKRDPSNGRGYVKSIFDRLELALEAECQIRERMSSEKLEKWDSHIAKKMFDKEETYEEKQYQDRKKQIDVSAEPKRRPCAAELRHGYTRTPYQDQKVQYGRLGSSHVDSMMAELNARNIPYSLAKCGIRILTKILQGHLKEKWTTENPGVAESIYDENAELTKYFHPEIGRDRFPYDEVKKRK